MLHWLFIFSYLLICSFIALIFCNKSLLSIIILSELLLLIFFVICLVLCSFCAIYYVAGLGFILLVFGGLEISLNILLFLL